MYYKSVNKNSDKEMFYFLKNHFQYYTMNSWNGLKSIANNVKIYNIKDLDYDILEYLELDNYNCINDTIECWELEHNGYEVGFNGRSGGYLVLGNKKNNISVLDIYIEDSENYEDFKELLKYYNERIKDYHNRLKEQVELVQDFDKLCDNLVEVCIDLKNNYEIVEEEIIYTKNIKVLKEKGV